jgi:hypothetical protein
MTGEAGFITVYRSADQNAEEDATAVHSVLVRNGIEARLCDDKVVGVVPGSYEVRVPENHVPQAESIISQIDQDDPGAADPSHDLDMVTVRRTMGTTAEMEAFAIKGILDANGIPSIVVGNTTLPNLSFFVQVAKADVETAQAAIAEAEAAGPAAAAEAERESEAETPPQV